MWNAGPGHFTFEQQATFLQLSLYMLWREGVDAVIWFNLRDRREECCFAQGGLFTNGGSIDADQPKPAYTAFRFPLVVVRSGGRTLAWGRAPSRNTPVVVERSEGAGWRELATVAPGRDRVFRVAIGSPGTAAVRARQGADASLASPVTTTAPP